MKELNVLPTLLISLAVGVMSIALYHFKVAPHSHAELEHEGPAVGIVVVDTENVLKEFMARMEQRVQSGEAMSEQELHMSGSRFGAEYLTTVKRYRDAGYLVIDKKYVLGVPNESEVTEDVGRALGLPVVAKPDPFELADIR